MDKNDLTNWRKINLAFFSTTNIGQNMIEWIFQWLKGFISRKRYPFIFYLFSKYFNLMEFRWISRNIKYYQTFIFPSFHLAWVKRYISLVCYRLILSDLNCSILLDRFCPLTYAGTPEFAVPTLEAIHLNMLALNSNAGKFWASFICQLTIL